MGSLATYDNEVVKSPMDKRSYRTVHLPNGLSALLVHDPEINPDGYPLQSEGPDSDRGREEGRGCTGEEGVGEEKEANGEINGDGSDGKEGKRGTSVSSPTKQAAVAMCVKMGSFSDPPNAQGLAHFVEHMLFMGSSEFPDENEYASYLSKHGGSSNAFTEWEYTCYYFDVNHKFLLGALKRFSQFFISPLVKEDALEREVLAVDSEFNQVLQNDSCRLSQLQCHTSSPTNPVNKFSWGNKKSLYEAMGNGVNMREEVLKMFKENYHGGMMKLVVIGGEPIEILEDWVRKLFIKVKAGSPVKLAVEKKCTPFWKRGKQYKLEAVKDVHNVELSWTLPCLHKEYLKKPHCYLAHLLGHEGKGSLCSLLKAKGWATSIEAGVNGEGTHKSSFAYIFTVTIDLTSEGLEEIYEVVGVVYQYIKILRQSRPQEWIFKELQEIGNVEFRFAEEQSQDDYAVDLSVSSLFYPEKHTICGAYVYEEWDPALIEQILSFLSPENMRIDLLTKSFDKDSEAVQYEPWFGSRYIEDDIPLHLLDTWRDPAEIDPSLHLPTKNEFIPSNFTLRSANLPKSLKSSKPKCILDEPLIKLWYKMDQTFNVPRANVYFLITLKDAYSSLKASLLTELFVDLLRDALNELLYQAGIAGLMNSLCNFDDKMEIRIWGYNDKLSVLLSKILLIFSSFSPTIDRFKVIKEDMERAYRNSNLEPLDHSTNLRLHILYERSWELEQQLSTLQNLTLSDLLDFIPYLLSQMHIEGLCLGNLTEEESIDISNIFTNTLCMKPLPKELRYYDKVLCLPTGASLLRSVNVKNKIEVNSVVEVYFQIEQQLRGREAIRLSATIDLFDDLINEPFFDQLRTKEQLGYTVTCGPRLTTDVLGFCFTIQSSEYDPFHLQNRIDNFIDGLQQLLDGIDDETFEHHRSGLIANKLQKVPSLVREADIYWDEITMQRYYYGISEDEARELKTIQKSDVIDLYNTYIKQGSHKRRRLAVHVWGCNADIADTAKMQQSSWKVIHDIDFLKLSSEFYSCQR